VIFITARMESKRLPGKVLMSLHGRPLLARLIERLDKTNLPIMVCTGDGLNNPIMEFCHQHEVPCYRGDEKDVMTRLLIGAYIGNYENIVRVTADNPLTDPDILTLLVKLHLQNKNDYTYIDGPPSGTKCEVINVEALRKLRERIQDPELQENMTPALKTMDKVQKVLCPSEWYSNERLTVDTLEDLQKVRKIYTHFRGYPPSLRELIQWMNSTNSLENGPQPLTAR